MVTVLVLISKFEVNVMQELLLICSLFIHFYDQEKLAFSQSKIEKINDVELIGTLDFDDEDRLVLRHFPEGNIKPAVLYVHPLVFEKRSSKLKAYKYFGKNVKVRVSYLKLGDTVFILVKELELFVIDI